jgi:hypothetical protein
MVTHPMIRRNLGPQLVPPTVARASGLDARANGGRQRVA